MRTSDWRRTGVTRTAVALTTAAMTGVASADAPATTATAPAPPFGASEDEFLAVVYDESTDQLRLYVDDISVSVSVSVSVSASVTGKDTWTPTGDLQIGRSLTAGTGTDCLTGELDDVHTYAGVLDQTRLAMLGLGGSDI